MPQFNLPLSLKRALDTTGSTAFTPQPVPLKQENLLLLLNSYIQASTIEYCNVDNRRSRVSNELL
jgi:hypothetical protein